jgi:hypothetical protein
MNKFYQWQIEIFLYSFFNKLVCCIKEHNFKKLPNGCIIDIYGKIKYTSYIYICSRCNKRLSEKDHLLYIRKKKIESIL